jgi:DNA-binding MarR family transcriptional regulator
MIVNYNNNDRIPEMLRQKEKKNQYERHQQQEKYRLELSKHEIQILNCIRGQARTEKKIAKMTRLDIVILSPLVTELMLKGYVETIRRHRLFFFSREYCVITIEGLAALEQSRNPFENLIELIKERTLETIDNMAANSPLMKLTLISAKAAYKTLKVLI